MTRKRNPYETVTNIVVFGVGLTVTLGILGILGYFTVDGIIRVGWEFIGAALFFAGLVAILALIIWGLERLGKWWLKKSDEWDRNHQTHTKEQR